MTPRLMTWLTPTLALGLTACVSTGPEQPLAVTMTREATSLGTVDAEIDNDVHELWVTVQAIEVRPAGDDRMWRSLDVEPFDLNLAALPTSEDNAETLVFDALEPGEYEDIRLFTAHERIVLGEDIWLGEDALFEAGTPYDVRIPSGDQTGIKTDQGFTHSSGDEELALVFDEDLTYNNLAATGQGRVIVSPVLHVEPPEVDLADSRLDESID